MSEVAALPCFPNSKSFSSVTINLHKTSVEIRFIALTTGSFNQIDIFVNYNWFDTRWQQYSTHLHTNDTQNNTINLGSVRAVPRVCESYPGICLTTEEKAWKNLSQGSRRVPVGTVRTIN